MNSLWDFLYVYQAIFMKIFIYCCTLTILATIYLSFSMFFTSLFPLNNFTNYFNQQPNYLYPQYQSIIINNDKIIISFGLNLRDKELSLLFMDILRLAVLSYLLLWPKYFKRLYLFIITKWHHYFVSICPGYDTKLYLMVRLHLWRS